MEAFELNSFDQFAITLIKTHLLVTAVLCTFFLCSVLIGKSFQFAFLRVTDDASKWTTTISESTSQLEPPAADVSASSAKCKSQWAFRPAEPRDGFQEFKH